MFNTFSLVHYILHKDTVMLNKIFQLDTNLKVSTNVRLRVVLGICRVCELIQEAVKDVHETLHKVQVSGRGDTLLHIRLTPLQLEPEEVFSDKGKEWRHKAVKEGSKDSLVLLCESLREFCQPRLH